MFLAQIPTQLEYIAIPEGASGTRATLHLMGKVTRQARADPIIRDTAKNLVMACMPGDYRSEVNECFLFVRNNIRYLQDTNGMERLTYPADLLLDQAGDCDDKSMLLASLLESIGHPCRFIAVGYTTPNEFEHVFVETRIDGEWIACETTLNVPLGWAPVPPNVDQALICKMVEHV